MHLSLRAVRQSLAARSVRCGRTTPYPDGRCRYFVKARGQPERTTDDLDHLYILGLRMASRRDGSGGAPAFT